MKHIYLYLHTIHYHFIIRQLRVFKLAKSWSTMRELLSAIGKSMTGVGYVGLMMIIYIYIFAVMGMKLFKKAYHNKFGSTQPRFNFDSFAEACMLIFRILCGEWSDPIKDAVAATGSYASIIFFILAYVIGNLLVSNIDISHWKLLIL